MRDTDSAEQSQRLVTLIWSGIGGVIGFLAGGLGSAQLGIPFAVGVLGGAVIGTAAMYAGLRWIGRVVGDSVVSIIAPSGRGLPSGREYSLADSHAARGHYQAAEAELIRCAELYANDPEPALRLARLLRDRLDRPEEALDWLRKAINLAGDAALEMLLTRELVELSAGRLGAPERALPDLARLAERHAGLPAGAWARLEITQIRKSSRKDV